MITTPPAIYHSPYSIDPNSAPTNTETPSTATVTRKKRGVADSRKLWPQSTTITISFMDTPEKSKKFIKQHISTFAEFINLKLQFVEGNEGHIRISTHKNIKGDWSKIGTDALEVVKHEPTMHLNLQNVHHSFIKRNILHEFGHALGLVHEHQHPQNTLDFNKPELYKAFGPGGTSGLTPEQIDFNIITPLAPTHLTTSQYDQKSIMHYEFPDYVLVDQETTPLNGELSEGDKAFLKSLYPPPIKTPANTYFSRLFKKGLV